MIVLPQLIELKWNWYTKKYFPLKGYEFTKYKDTFQVYVLDLPDGSECKIDVICDYCNKDYKLKYSHYINININGIIHKDACKKCGHLKSKESNFLTYGVESTNSLSHVKNKKREIFAFSHGKVEKLFEDRNYIMISQYVNSNTTIEYLCKRHIDKGILTINYSHFSRGQGCKYCDLERRKVGENNGNWQGGVSSLNSYLRSKMYCWTYESLKKDDFKCIISGSKKNLQVHHFINFKDIVSEALLITKIPILKQISLYESKDLEILTSVCFELHYKYGLGITMTQKLHNEFHSLYGKKNNTILQFEEFYKNKICEF